MYFELRPAVIACLALIPSACNGRATPLEFDAVVERSEPRFPGRFDAFDQLSCKDVCEVVLNRGHAHDNDSIIELSRCRLTEVEGEAETEGDPYGPAVRVQCAGTWRFLAEGRRPLASFGSIESTDADSELGHALAACAHLEALSVHAFVELAAQLEALGAPAELIRRCLAAADDERHHEQMLRRLARAHGASVAEARVETRSTVDLSELLIHNASEGCVAESFAALAASVRATHAADPRIRATYRVIAADELRHGQLAWDIHAWGLGQLPAPARAQVNAALAEAIDRLPELARALAALPRELQGLDLDTATCLAKAFAHHLAA